MKLERQIAPMRWRLGNGEIVEAQYIFEYYSGFITPYDTLDEMLDSAVYHLAKALPKEYELCNPSGTIIRSVARALEHNECENKDEIMDQLIHRAENFEIKDVFSFSEDRDEDEWFPSVNDGYMALYYKGLVCHEYETILYGFDETPKSDITDRDIRQALNDAKIEFWDCESPQQDRDDFDPEYTWYILAVKESDFNDSVNAIKRFVITS